MKDFIYYIVVAICILLLTAYIIYYKRCKNDIDSQRISLNNAVLEQGEVVDSMKLTDICIFEPKYDFGKVKQGTNVIHDFRFVNIGENNCIVEYVKPDCICTDYSFTSGKIYPGEEGAIQLKLDTSDKIGRVQIYAILKVNTQNKFYKLRLYGEVL